MKVLEFKHHSPFDGCFWRWEFLCIDDDGDVLPIIWTENGDHLSDEELVKAYTGQEEIAGKWGFTKFDCFTMYEWGDELFREVPDNYIPDFAYFAEENDLEFHWWCEECGAEMVTAAELWASIGWRSNGAVGLESNGWLCSACQPLYCEDEEY